MTFDFLDRRSAERFAELLDETTAGRHQHARGQADEHLAELVAIGHTLSAARPAVRVDPEFRMGLRAMLVATAERDGIGSAAPAADDEPEAAAPARRVFSRTGRRLRARGAIIIGVAAGAMAVSGISAASENASPGDALYGVKRSTERAQLAMAGSDVTRGQLSLGFARNRLAEAAAMNGADAKFADALDDMDADTKQGVKLLTSAAVVRKDPAGLDPVDSFTDNQRRVLTLALDKLTPANRVRALDSLSLLDTVRQRAENVRTGLTCAATLAATGSDALGPQLGPCKSGTAGSTSDDRGTIRNKPSSGSSSKKDPDKNEGAGRTKKTAEPKVSDTPTTEPTAARQGTGATPDAVLPSTDTVGTTDQEEPEPLVSEDPQNPSTAEDKGLLGGLLSNIFGSDQKN
ncbi:hypothetical protein L083_7653 [Actinoplanes sp. N902-109]|nr:DUF5667 domain-containing protein [Actinoplanes sp. N902-109]AGL21163.1 hypothetical protein L083_7653 [Actinoplanes sp. N902-109]